MTPNEQFNAEPTKAATAGNGLNAIKTASTICLLGGIWFFVSPWIYNAYANPDAWNCWIVGGFMILFGATRLWRPADLKGLSWCNTVLAIWAFFSPWIYGYTGNHGRFINSLCVGVVVFAFSIASAMISRKLNGLPQLHTSSR